MKRRVQVEIDLAALARNYRRIAAHVRPAKVLCVLKANAYGLGVGAFARTLSEAGCTMFGVAEPFEALELKKCLRGRKADVQILSSVLPDEIPAMVRAGESSREIPAYCMSAPCWSKNCMPKAGRDHALLPKDPRSSVTQGARSNSTEQMTSRAPSTYPACGMPTVGTGRAPCAGAFPTYGCWRRGGR